MLNGLWYESMRPSDQFYEYALPADELDDVRRDRFASGGMSGPKPHCTIELMLALTRIMESALEVHVAELRRVVRADASRTCG